MIVFAIGVGWIAFALIYRLTMHTDVTLTADGCLVSQRTVKCTATPKRWLVFSVTAHHGENNALRITAQGSPPAATFTANGKGGYMFTWLPVVHPEHAPDLILLVHDGTRDIPYHVSLSWND